MCNNIKIELVKSRHGRFYIMPNDIVIGKSLQNYGEYAEHEMMLLSHWIESEDTVIDVGANIGTHSVFFSHQVGSFLGSWLGGKLFDIYESYEIMWWISVALGFISALMHMPIKEKAVQRLANQQI